MFSIIHESYSDLVKRVGGFHRQGAKNAKNTFMSPRKILGDFGTGLATFADLAIQKTTKKLIANLLPLNQI
jgi:hypothetical protein